MVFFVFQIEDAVEDLIMLAMQSLNMHDPDNEVKISKEKILKNAPTNSTIGVSGGERAGISNVLFKAQRGKH